MSDYKTYVGVVNGQIFKTVAKTEAKARANIRYQAAQAGLAWCRSEDVEIKEVA